MKILLTLVASLFALTAQAQTTFEHFTFDDEWPTFGENPNIVYPGEFFCTGGGDPVDLFVCEGGKGIHIRGTEMISYIVNPVPYDARLEGMAWFDLAANWDSDYTGPVIGSWRIYPTAYAADPSSFWEGTYTAKREVVPDLDNPFNPYHAKWVTTIKYDGYGFGALDGQKIKATEVITTYTPVPVPWELVPYVTETGPEGKGEMTIITED